MPPEAPPFRYTPNENEELSNAIINALSAAKGHDVSEDDYTLYDVVDPDALDHLFRQHGLDDSVTVEFTTHEANVVLWGDSGSVTIDVQDLAPSTTEEE